MKLSQSILVAAILITRLHALDAAAFTAVAKRFDDPSADAQYQARIELNRLAAQATLPGKGDPAALTKVLISVLEAADTSDEAKKYLLRALARVATPAAIEPLARLLEGANPRLREEARGALSGIRDPQATTALEAALRKSTDRSEKLGLIDALAIQKAESAIAVIAPFAIDADAEMATSALSAIARIGGGAAIATLTKASASDKLSPALKADAAKALLLAGEGDPKIAATIFKSTAPDDVKLAAFLSLMRHAPAGDKPALIETALKSEDAGLRQAGLAEGIRNNLPSLQSSLALSMDQMPGDDRLVVLANIHHLTPAATAEAIALSRMTAADDDERASAVAALGRIGTKPAFDAVLKAMAAREPRINQAAANALASMQYPEAETTLLAMLKGSSGENKILAIKAMVFRQLPGGGAILLDAIKGTDQAASKEAMKSLYFTASIDDLRGLCTLTTATTDADLRRTLASLCDRIATRINTDEARDLAKPLK